MAEKDEKKTLEEVMKEINKQSPGSVIHGNAIQKYDVVIPTGSLGLDVALGTGGLPLSKIIEIYGWESSGKAQPLSSKVLTPYGWKTIGEMEVGTIISTPDGGDSTVIAVHPQGVQDVYKITFDDKSFTYCTKDHLWSVNGRRTSLGEVLSVGELLEIGLTKKSSNQRKFKIPTTKPVSYEQYGKITVDPYILGILLGDGGLTDRNVRFTTADKEILEELTNIVHTQYKDVTVSDVMGEFGYCFKKKTWGHDKAEICYQLHDLGLMGKYSYEKHVPKEYMYTSIENRIALLQGLMDSDGSSDHGCLSFSSTSIQLSKDYQELVRGLGLRCTTSSRITKYTNASGQKVDGRVSYRTTAQLNTSIFKPFRLTRKLASLSSVRSEYCERFIENIELVGREECQCITIGHPDELYITDDFIVTHNSTLVQTIAGNAQRMGLNVLYLDSEGSISEEYAKNLGISLEDLYVLNLDESAGEGIYNKMEKLIETGEISVCIVDSYNACIPHKLLSGELGESTMGVGARLMNQVVTKMNTLAIKYNVLFLMCGQLRMNIGQIYGNPEVTQGGASLKFYASVRLNVSRSTTEKNSIMDGDVRLGNKTTIKVMKNKLSVPFKSCTYDIIYNQGIDRIGEIIELAHEHLPEDVYKKYGNSVTYMGTKQKIEDFKQLLTDTPELYEELKEKILKTVNL